MKPCRDCGYVFEANERGCPRCAMNLEAESMIERFIWYRAMPGIVIGILALVGIVYLLIKFK